MLRKIFKVLTTPSDYENDWYGYASNQTSHAALGLFFTWLVCFLSCWVSDDLPDREKVFIGIAFVYAAKEIFFDKWQGLDTVEDFTFFVVYGAGGTLYSFKQIEPFSSDVVFSILNVAPFLAMFSLHLFAGVFVRVKGSLK